MPDQFDGKKRSEIKAKVHDTNTSPEIFICSILVFWVCVAKNKK
jgi:G:T-mismatch repair DNA endonuclease (very short patch repair protein)